ncbi:acyl- thioester hydrolase [Fusarium albosuccineum]|uniref:Acyl- thioester hydrolase n=1 Tax=Fusarium albosuccineum TaxID=1237068 RepID=A0A8H4P860_9HYPO|nr:acyl- thioester hydrolase [Fusarium albosuccineum]
MSRTASPAELKARKRQDYAYMLDYRTRWNDNDIFDSVLNAYLIENCGLHPPTSKEYGMCVHTHTDYFASVAYPAVAEVALRVNKLGRTSVTYELALFEKGVDEVKAVGEFVQVYVDRDSGRPLKAGFSSTLRGQLEKLLVVDEVDKTKSKL